MQRSPVPIRRDWRQRVEALGFEFHTLDGPYWVEDACYRFDQVEIDRLESAGNELHAMCLDAVADIVRTGDYARLGLGPIAATLAERAWRAGETHRGEVAACPRQIPRPEEDPGHEHQEERHADT